LSFRDAVNGVRAKRGLLAAGPESIRRSIGSMDFGFRPSAGPE